MKLAPMEVNYYIENPVMDIENEPTNYAYRYYQILVFVARSLHPFYVMLMTND